MQIPAKQTNYETALDMGFDEVRKQPRDVLEALGATVHDEDHCSLPVLNVTFNVNLDAREMTLDGTGEAVSAFWQILALHYLVGEPSDSVPGKWVAFADMPEVRGYQSVYQGRVIARFCFTAGRDRDAYVKAAEALHGEPVDFGDVAFQFVPFPQVPLRIAWFDGGEEFPNSASFLYPDNILSHLPPEDVIVVSERLISALQGKGF